MKTNMEKCHGVKTNARAVQTCTESFPSSIRTLKQELKHEHLRIQYQRIKILFISLNLFVDNTNSNFQLVGGVSKL